ncbi:MAG: type IV pili twitching motility protein PilT, partial [Gammaproteobacteria bacterium]|nr:type IV pili twitching motility protein PilT [Gammaproteobacteria bacterium]
LFDLYTAGEITYEHALSHADSPNDLRLMIKLEADPSGSIADKVSSELKLEENKPGSMRRR